MIVSNKPVLSLDEWRKKFFVELIGLLKSQGFFRKGQLFWREGATYWEGFLFVSNKWGRGYFINVAVVDKASVRGPFYEVFKVKKDDWFSNPFCTRIEKYINYGIDEFPFVETFCYQTYSTIVSEVMLMASNKIAERFHQKPPHLIDVQGKVSCTLDVHKDVVLLYKSLEEQSKTARSSFVNLLIGDFGASLPNGWTIIPRYEREVYLQELKLEYGQQFSINQGKYVVTHEKYMVFAHKGTQILLLTDNALFPIVTMDLLWSGELESILKANPLFYDRFVGTLGD